VVISLLLALGLAQEPARPSFTEWVAGVRAEAVARGLRPEIVDAALAGVEEPLRSSSSAIARRLKPFLARALHRARLTSKLILSGRDAYARHRDLLEEIGDTLRSAAADHRRDLGHRIQLWPLQRRAADRRGARHAGLGSAPRDVFFRGELFDALEILNRGDIDLAHLRGSWPARWARSSSCRPAI